MIVGAHMPWPMMNTPPSWPNSPSSCDQITRSMGVAPRPPNSFGQWMQAQPASYFFFCQSFDTLMASVSRPVRFCQPSAGRFAAIHAFACVRKLASSGESLKSMMASGYAAFRSSRRLIRRSFQRGRLPSTRLSTFERR